MRRGYTLDSLKKFIFIVSPPTDSFFVSQWKSVSLARRENKWKTLVKRRRLVFYVFFVAFECRWMRNHIARIQFRPPEQNDETIDTNTDTALSFCVLFALSYNRKKSRKNRACKWWDDERKILSWPTIADCFTRVCDLFFNFQKTRKNVLHRDRVKISRKTICYCQARRVEISFYGFPLFSQDNRINYRATWCVGRGGQWEGRKSNSETDKFLGALSQINERIFCCANWKKICSSKGFADWP